MTHPNNTTVAKRKRAPLDKRLWSRVEKTATCWFWRGNTWQGGYGRIGVNGHSRLVHRVAYELTFGPIPDGLFVCHRCDNRACVRPDHLFLGTPADNTTDMVNKGRLRVPRGELSGNAKLTNEQAGAIRALLAQGVKGREIARRFGVSESIVSKIRCHNRYAHN